MDKRKYSFDTDSMAKKLVELRGKRSQREVAEALGISVSALAMYETGERVPRDQVKVKIANYFKKPIHTIFFVKE
jgi:DNA-binding XRE family transcriptional regulator